MPNYQGKSILVTGGTGSIGSQLVERLLERGAGVVRVLSNDEDQLFELRSVLGEEKPVRYLLGDVADRDRLRRAMEGIDVVFHAAALKDIPACEYNPFEAVQVNVLGTQNMIQAALDAGVGRVVFISTDKVVHPTSTMGATKLLAERIVLAAPSWIRGTTLAAVRFGNVLDTKRSVVPVVLRAIRRDQPVPVTDPKMTRFFMQKKEAADLVVTAGETAASGEAWILRMKAVRVRELIDALVEYGCDLYGKDPDRVSQKIIGPRRGERTHEALLTEEELPQVTLSDDGRFFILNPYRDYTRVGFEPASLSPSDYKSEHAERLTKEEVLTLLQEMSAGTSPRS